MPSTAQITAAGRLVADGHVHADEQVTAPAFSALVDSTSTPGQQWHVWHLPLSGWRCGCPFHGESRHILACKAWLQDQHRPPL